MSRFTRMLILISSALFLVAAPGCIFSPDDDGGGGGGKPPVVYKDPTSKTNLMENFQTAYGGMDYDAYVDMLHEDYQFTYKLRDTSGNPTTTAVYYKADEIAVARNMFDGNPGTDQNGEFIGGISRIDINSFNITVWTAIQPNDPYYGDFEGAESAVYDVEIVFNYSLKDGSPATFTVNGQQNFVVAPFPVEVDGVMREKWMIIGQQDEDSWTN